MYVGRVGQNFRSIYSLPTNDEEGTWVNPVPPITILLGITAVSLAGFPVTLTVYKSCQLILALQQCQHSTLNYEGYTMTR